MAYTDIDKPDEYFNTKLYTGNGSTNAITGVGFQPDWVWVKDRTSANSHGLFDVIRGATNALLSNTTNATVTNANYLQSFDSDGFTLGSEGAFNTNSNLYASWNWLAGGTASSNTDGSITSSVSANTTSGFSIVTYTGNGVSGASVGHGLGVAPSFIIVKQRDSGNDWNVFHHKNTSAPETDFLVLNETDATLDASDRWNDTMPNATNVFLGNSNRVNNNGNSYVMYTFAEKKGFSKFGSYTGNGNSDGTFVYTGFKPAWILWKRSDDSIGRDWQIHDNKRSTFNELNKILRANTSDAEVTSTGMDFTSNGFKLRTSDGNYNASGANYIYMCFAENPFVTSTGIPTTAR